MNGLLRLVLCDSLYAMTIDGEENNDISCQWHDSQEMVGPLLQR
jgi:hypothetical protein